MTMFQDSRPYSLFKPGLPSTNGFTTVHVSADLNNRRLYRVSWPAQGGATRYTVYASPSPLSKNKFNDYPKTTTSIDFELPIFLPEDVTFYFWVSYINPLGNEVFIQSEPSFVAINGAFEDVPPAPLDSAIYRDIVDGLDFKYFVEEIRRRHLARVQLGGEDFILYMRRHFGQSCSHQSENPSTPGRTTPMFTSNYNNVGTDFNPAEPTMEEDDEAKDPSYGGTWRCKYCFGVGISGGYYPGIRIKARYGDLPRRPVIFKDQGLEFTHNFGSMTIWHPKLRQNDVLVRVSNNERYTIKEVGQSEIRGIPLHQQFNASIEPRNSILYQITDDAIKAALEKESSFDITRFNWGVWM